MIEWFVIILVIIGTILSLLSSLGFIRFPDVYNRSHAATKSTTLGTMFILIAAFFYFWLIHSIISVRLLLGIIFVFLTAPVAGHLIVRSAYRSGTKLADTSIKDELRDDLLKWEQQQKKQESNEQS